MPRRGCTAIVWLVSNISCIQGARTSPEDLSPLEAQVASAGAVDPGPRGAPLGAGGPAPGLSADEVSFFAAARVRFHEVQSVSGSIAGEDSTGPGPVFNPNSCAPCPAN